MRIRNLRELLNENLVIPDRFYSFEPRDRCSSGIEVQRDAKRSGLRVIRVERDGVR